MKKTILPALAMLIISAVMLSTASYAWFAIGSSVTATGMTVGIKSDSAFLVIAADGDQSKINATYDVDSVTFTDGAVKVYPVALNETALGALSDVDFRDEVTNKSVWYYKTADDRSESESTTNAVTVTKDLSNYTVHYRVYVSVSPATPFTMGAVTAKVTIDGDAAVGVVVAGPDGYENYKAENDHTSLPVSITGTETLAKQIDEKTPIAFDIYIYYNGEHQNVYTDNLLAGLIEDGAVTVSFLAAAE